MEPRTRSVTIEDYMGGFDNDTANPKLFGR